MKKTTTMIVALMLGICAFASADQNTNAERAKSFYKQGLIAMNEGDFDLAKSSFREVLRLYPKHPLARKQLIYISSNRNTLEIKRRKDALRKVKIPKVNLQNATVDEAIAVLSVQVQRESKGKVAPNFILQDPTGAFKKNRITLRLNNIPAETFLRYIADMTGANVRYDNHAVVLIPRKPATPPGPKKEDAGTGFGE